MALIKNNHIKDKDSKHGRLIILTGVAGSCKSYLVLKNACRLEKCAYISLELAKNEVLDRLKLFKNEENWPTIYTREKECDITHIERLCNKYKTIIIDHLGLMDDYGKNLTYKLKTLCLEYDVNIVAIYQLNKKAQLYGSIFHFYAADIVWTIRGITIDQDKSRNSAPKSYWFNKDVEKGVFEIEDKKTGKSRFLWD